MFRVPWRPQAFTRGLKEAFQLLEAHAEAIGGAHDLLAAIVELQGDIQTPGSRAQRVVIHHRVSATHHGI